MPYPQLLLFLYCPPPGLSRSSYCSSTFWSSPCSHCTGSFSAQYMSNPSLTPCSYLISDLGYMRLFDDSLTRADHLIFRILLEHFLSWSSSECHTHRENFFFGLTSVLYSSTLVFFPISLMFYSFVRFQCKVFRSLLLMSCVLLPPPYLSRLWHSSR